MAVSDSVMVQSVNSFLGSAPHRLINSGMNVNALRTNGLLRHEEWLEIDQTVVATAQATLNGVADLRTFNLVQPLGGLGTIVSSYERASDMTDANVDMSGTTAGQEDVTSYDMAGVPIPITHKDFRINIRELEAARRLGNRLDTTHVAVATRKVVDMLEYMLFNGGSVKSGGYSLYGYTTHPNRNTGSADGDFGTISNVYSTVLKMIGAARNDFYEGPHVLYVASEQYTEMMAVYTDGSGQSALGRCLANLPSLRAIKPSTKLTAGSLVLVTMVRDVVDLALAQDVVSVEWDEMGGMQTRYKVMAAMAARVKADAAGHSGVVHYTGA